ncbi:MAG: histidine kinase [Bacteroidota bacterium]
MNKNSYWPNIGSRLFVGLHVSVWLLICLMSVAAFLRMLPTQQAILRGLLNTAMMMVLFYVQGYLYQWYYEKRKYWVFSGSTFLLFATITVARFHINEGFSYWEDATEYYQPGPVSHFFGAIITNLTTLLNSLLYQLIRSRVIMKQRQSELLSEQKEAKLQFLRAQMNPHFLFNTLNNIYSLAVVKSDKTAPLVLRLSELLQYVIYDAQKNKAPLAKEVAVVEEYIDLFELQFEDPPQVEFNYQLPRQPVMLEPLLLIPFVENCFKHADFAENPDAYVKLDLQVRPEGLHFTAVNSYNAQQQQKDRTGGVGLENIRRRLQLQYPTRHNLVAKGENGQFSVQFGLQFQKLPA